VEDEGLERDKKFIPYKRAIRVVGAALLIGLTSILVFAIQGQSRQAIASILSVGAATAGASFAVGGMTGFIFGIPRSLQELPARQPAPDELAPVAPSPASSLAFVGNTSLEQISDWLTKIIVGVGLTQLANIPSGLSAIGEFLAPSLGGLDSSVAFGAILVVYYGIGGFFVSYLWTRLYFRTLLEEELGEAAKAHAWEIERKETEAQRATETETATRRKPQVLWVDDNPWNNRREIALLEERGFDVTTRTSTEAALELLKADPNRFDVVLSDMGRGLDRTAGYTLLDAMRANKIETPFVIYAGSNDPKHDLEAKQRGALGSTNAPSRLLELVESALQPQPPQKPRQ
jgi:CheY-like chemotaxis protein